jgi:hypothetical protein
MNKLTFAIATLALCISAGASANAAVIPCEDLLKQLREAEKTATLSADDKNKVADLESKGTERCKADDDKRADKFFDDALKIVTKK